MKSESDVDARMWDVDHSKAENLEDFFFFLQLENFHNTHISLMRKTISLVHLAICTVFVNVLSMYCHLKW